ncbi:DUF6090 family protein [Planktosalinus lacus]|uniref:Uncharacterized protein n=1 Tax=Planktosalinus lacus TaxID=1526573 RepID=A0A8J2Y6Y8_9FLAO|nr:DUF6090 family protein [Planktosalinus lacus]GGD93765.1 hypothetical protein GCM10011312_16890 [Planktosalinus lacus]
MIKFFRRIRHKLLTENNFRKYLLYAIGEIILVVIGILIALQINNWNDRKQQHQSDIEFLNNLKGEIILDTLAFSHQTKWYNEINENVRSTLFMIDTSEALNEEQIKLISKTIVQAEYLLPVQKNIDRNGLIVASGSIKRLNRDLHYKYLRYLESIDFSYDLTIKLGDALVTIANNELYPSVDLNFTDDTKSQVTFDLKTLKNNRTVHNALQKSIYYRGAIIDVNKPILTRARSIIEAIDAILEKE